MTRENTMSMFFEFFLLGPRPLSIVLLIEVLDYADDVPLEGPKAKMVKKWSGNGFGPSQMTCPKSGLKVPKKWSKKGPGKIWGHKTTNFAWALAK